MEWILAEERMPQERESMFAKLKGTPKWRKTMFEKTSARVLVTVKFDDGTTMTDIAFTLDGKWNLDNRVVPRKVIAWMPFPEPLKLEN